MAEEPKSYGPVPSREELKRMDWKDIKADIPPEDRAWDSDYDPGADHLPEGVTIHGHDPVELARKWGSNPGLAGAEATGE